MRRLVLVHGINNEGRSEQKTIDTWLDALSKAVAPADMAMIRRAEIVAPYYGDVLAEETNRKSQAGAQPVAQGLAETSATAPDEAEFYAQALEDFAPAAGVTEADIRAAAGVAGPIEQGLPHDRRFLALLRALETISPLKGRVVLRLLPQAFVYLNRATATQAVNDIVKPALADENAVVVAHSLGTIVTFKLLREAAAPQVPFYLTLGSPLAVRAVQNAVGPAFERPGCAESWLNALDPDDAVTIGRALNTANFGDGVENIDDIENGSGDPHDIRMYLRDTRVADAIVRAMSA
jgi:hypothetical protein